MPQTVHINGVGAVHFPDGMTPDQIEQAIERDILPQKPAARAPATKADAIPGWARAGRGAQDVLDRTSQLFINAGEKVGLLDDGLADIATQQMNDERAQYAKDLQAGGHEGVDWARIAGNAGMQAPLMLMRAGGPALLSKVVAGAVQGAAGGALQYDETNSVGGTARNVGVGTVAGAVLNPLTQWFGGKVGEAVKYTAGKIQGLLARAGGEASEQAIAKAVPELQQLPPAVRQSLIAEARKTLIDTGDLPAEQLSRKANLLANDVTPTRSMVTRNPQDWAVERNLSKLTDDLAPISSQLTDIYKGNDAALSSRLQSFGGGKATQEAYGETVMKSLDDLADASQKDVSKLYEAVRSSRGDELAMDARNLAEAIDDLSDSPVADPITEAARRRLTRLGMMKDGQLTAGTLTVKQAEGLRQFINQQPNVFGKRQIINAIDQDVLGGVGDDVFALARKAAGDRFAMLENPATQRALNAYGELTQGKTAQGFIQSQVIDAATQDVRSLVQTLDKIPDAAKKDFAFGAMKGGVLSYLQDKSINQVSGQFSGANLTKAMERIGEEKLRLVLGDAQLRQLRSLARAGIDATFQPPYAAVNSSNTAPALLKLTRGARSIPGVPLLVSEEVQRAAARSGYQDHLAAALAARAAGVRPEIPVRTRQIGQVLTRSVVGAGAVAGNQALNQIGNKPDDKRKSRK